MADKVKCGACGRLTLPGSFCEKCGQNPGAGKAPVPSQPEGMPASGIPAKAGTTNEIAPDPESFVVPPSGGGAHAESSGAGVERSPTTIITKSGLKAERDTAPSETEIPAKAGTTSGMPTGAATAVISGCPDLRVEYNVAQFFIEGISSPFTFRVTPLVDGIEDIRIFLESDAGNGISADKHIRKRLIRDRSFIQRFNLQLERIHGVVSFDIYITYSKDGEDCTFEHATTHKVYPADSSAREVVETIIVNINNEINAGHAADATVNNGLEQLQDLRSRTSANDQARTLIDKIVDLPPTFSALALYPTDWEPPVGFFSSKRQPVKRSVEQAPADARYQRLTLKLGSHFYHLVAGDAASFGRDRHNNDIGMRLFDRAGKATGELNKRTSRFHCRIEIHGDHCFVKDGGFSPEDGTTKASGMGTFVNGRQLAALGATELESGRIHCVGLAGAADSVFGAVVLDVEPVCCSQDTDSCWMSTDCSENMIACVRMRRRDEVPEAYVLVVRCVDLGAFSSDLAGVRVWQQGGGMMYSALGSKGWLRPRMFIQTASKRVQCMEWKQWGM